MAKRLAIGLASVIVAASLAVLAVGCCCLIHTRAPGCGRTGNSSRTGPTSQPNVAAIWVCPMHPNVTSDRPGMCPTCGMGLVQKDEAPAAQHHGADHH